MDHLVLAVFLVLGEKLDHLVHLGDMVEGV